MHQTPRLNLYLIEINYKKKGAGQGDARVGRLLGHRERREESDDVAASGDRAPESGDPRPALAGADARDWRRVHHGREHDVRGPVGAQLAQVRGRGEEHCGQGGEGERDGEGAP